MEWGRKSGVDRAAEMNREEKKLFHGRENRI